MKTSRLEIVVLLILLVLLGIAYSDSNKKLDESKQVVMNPNTLLANKKQILQKKQEVAPEKIEKVVETEVEEKEEVVETTEVIEEAVEEVVIPLVYDGLTLEQLGQKLEKNLNSTLVGKGQVFANYAIELGIDPYLALAIVLHETGCSYNCSYLTNACNNIGGQKGTGCGEYAYFNSLDEGIYAFLNNLHKNYYAYGLVNPETIGPKYAEDPQWSIKVSNQIVKIRNS